MKNVRVKVRESCSGAYFDFGIYEGRKFIMRNNVGRQTYWNRKPAAIRNAKAMAKRIGIPYDPEIIKRHGC
jgi:hypothetical protein